MKLGISRAKDMTPKCEDVLGSCFERLGVDFPLMPLTIPMAIFEPDRHIRLSKIVLLLDLSPNFIAGYHRVTQNCFQYSKMFIMEIFEFQLRQYEET